MMTGMTRYSCSTGGCDLRCSKWAPCPCTEYNPSHAKPRKPIF